MRQFLVIVWCVFTIFISTAADVGLIESECVPAKDQAYPVLSDITLTFDLTQIYQANPNDAPSTIGICAFMTEENHIVIYKGLPEAGEILTEINQYIDVGMPGFEPGSNKLTFKLSKDYILEPDQLYTINIPGDIFMPDSESYLSDTSIVPATSYCFYGTASSENKLLLESISPDNGTSIKELDKITLIFNSKIRLASDAYAQLKEDDIILGTFDLQIDSEDPNVANIVIGEALYKNHTYSVNIPANQIISAESDENYSEINIDYSGESYHYFTYGRISPKNESEVNYLGIITVPIDCKDSEYLGRDFNAKGVLVKISGEESEVINSQLKCTVTENAKGFYIEVNNFNLEPESIYQVKVDGEQFCLWSYDNGGALKDTANEELILTYKTPIKIAPLPTQQFGLSTPSNDASAETLDEFKLMFEPYNFEDTFYYPVFASSSLEEGYNVLQVIDENTGENVASFEVDIKWDNDNNYWLENVNALDIPLLEGHTYNVVVPAGMFCCRFEPLHDVTLNDEYTVTLKGAYKTSFTVSCNYGDAITISNVVNRGEETTLTFNPSEDWSIKSVLVNDEEKDVENNVLVLSDVTEDTDVYVTYAFSGGVTFDYTTGVDSAVADCPYSVSTEPGYVIISKVDVGAQVEVYNTVGMLMASSEATESILKIGVNPGIVVVVIRNGSEAPVGIKIRVPES